MARKSLLEGSNQEFPGNHYTITMIGTEARMRLLEDLPDFYLRVTNTTTAEEMLQPFKISADVAALRPLNKDVIGEQIGKTLQGALDMAVEEAGEEWRIVGAGASARFAYQGEMAVARSYDHLRTETGCMILNNLLAAGHQFSYSNKAAFQVSRNGDYYLEFHYHNKVFFQLGVQYAVPANQTESQMRMQAVGGYLGKAKIFDREQMFVLRMQVNTFGQMNMYASPLQESSATRLCDYDLDQAALIDAIHSAAAEALPFMNREVFQVLSIEPVKELGQGATNPYDIA